MQSRNASAATAEAVRSSIFVGITEPSQPAVQRGSKRRTESPAALPLEAGENDLHLKA